MNLDLPVVPSWAHDMMKHTKQAQAVEGEYYRALSRGWDDAVAAHRSRSSRPSLATRSEEIAKAVDAIHYFAAGVLAHPAAHSAHATNLAHGLLHEVTDYVQAEIAVRKGRP